MGKKYSKRDAFALQTPGYPFSKWQNFFNPDGKMGQRLQEIEKKRANALRANLKRRKAAQKAQTQEKDKTQENRTDGRGTADAPDR